MFKLDDETRWILGRPNFVCGPIARQLAAAGEIHRVPAKAEEEQAAVIYWMLELHEAHGENWRDEADKVLKRTAHGAPEGR